MTPDDDNDPYVLYNDRLTIMDYVRIVTLPVRILGALIAYLMIKLDDWRMGE